MVLRLAGILPMNILWLSWRDIKNPKSGGAEKVAFEVTKRLARDKIEVIVFTSSFKNCLLRENINGVTIIRKGSSLTCRLHAFAYYLANKDNFDLVVDEINTLPFFSHLYAGKKSIAMIHQIAHEYWFNQISFPLSILGYILEKPSLWLYRKVPTITVSNSSFKDLKRIGFKNVKIIREGLDFKPSLPTKKENIILFLGRLTKAKGPQDALAAFSQISKQLPQLRLLLIGRADHKFLKILKQKSKDLQIQSKVSFEGFVSQKTKINLLKKAKIVLIPSVREGWNLVATEAGATGCVPIAYNVPGLRDSIKNGQTGLLVEPKPAALANGTLKLLKNETSRSQMAFAGYLWSKEFSWDNCYQDFKKIFLQFI